MNVPDPGARPPDSPVPDPTQPGPPGVGGDGQPPPVPGPPTSIADGPAPVSGPAAEPGGDPAEPYLPESLADMKKAVAGDRRDWLWEGYLLPGNVTLLTSLWKSGKSTLIATLLAKMKAGGLLGGLAVRAGRALVITEEDRFLWLERSKWADLDGHVEWICRPFQGRKPTEAEWQDLLAGVLRRHGQRPYDLVVIDALANLAPMRSENHAGQVLDALRPLHELTARGLVALVSHHPRKGPTLPGQAARGTGALNGSVDISIEMHPASRRPGDRRRRLRGYSRFAATPASLVLEWNAEGTDYLTLGSAVALDYEHGWPILRAILEQAERPMKRGDIYRRWPDPEAAPAKLTLWRWLGQARREGKVEQDGLGTRKEPFKYWLPGMLEKWHQQFLQEVFPDWDGNAGGKAPAP